MTTCKLLPGLLAAAFLAGAPAKAATSGEEALQDHKHGIPTQDVVQNRFFVKEGRFEVAPTLGYVPNNPMARRYVGGVGFGYHFSEQLSAQAVITYSPDLGEQDLKGLAKTLVQIAHTGASQDFQQPLDKVGIAALFMARWAPLYGKINLVGETVLNFDFYGQAGAGMLTKHDFFAKYDDGPDAVDPVILEDLGNEVKVGPALGIGGNFFLNQTIAIKLDTTFSLYVDNKPQYDPNVAVEEQRLYSNFVAGGGISMFFPKMKPRITNF